MEQYARLLVRVGANVQKDQVLVIDSPIDCAEFARLAQVEAYRAGAAEVVFRWTDEKSARVGFDMAADASFDRYPEWARAFFDGYSDAGAAFLHIFASDPEIMKGVDPERMSRKNKAQARALEHYRSRQMSGKHVWCVASVPTVAWARKVFPGRGDAEAIEALWKAIYETVRIDRDDPVAAWKEHLAALRARIATLQGYAFTALRYRNGLGTNLTVALPIGHLWFGGGEDSPGGYEIVANMPTEEVFTMPHKDGANGRVVASMPLNHNGNLVEGFWFEFKDGLVVDYGADKGLDTLKSLLDTDEGARRLGEVALVPYGSPISRLGILFYNTLFDENASCHFALGKAYPTCVSGGADMDAAALAAAGANDSLVHVDFMMGSADLSITGIRPDGSEVAVFADGDFAF
ncbi:MAG: aminopeptidase [Spirochaetes bacterium]|nr:aminopeptidase [Spirochaetota bacterium]MBU1079830.1 aminopeptidase [Spirochaetota bacterium]